LLAGVGFAAAVLAMPACGATEQVAEKVNNDAEQMSVANEQECAIEHTTLATAAEAMMAMNGVYPASVDEIIAAGLLREPPRGLDLTLGADGVYVVVPTPGGPCEGLTP
jgi:hypothetical protein